MGPVAVHVDKQGNRVTIDAGAVLYPEAIGPVTHLVPVHLVACLGDVHQHPRPDVDFAVSGVVHCQVPWDSLVARGGGPELVVVVAYAVVVDLDEPLDGVVVARGEAREVPPQVVGAVLNVSPLP